MCELSENQSAEPTNQPAVLDRVEDEEHAVLLVGDQETEFVIPATQLPEGAIPGKWLRVRIEDGTILEIVIDEEATQEAAARIASKLELLRKRGWRSQQNRED